MKLKSFGRSSILVKITLCLDLSPVSIYCYKYNANENGTCKPAMTMTMLSEDCYGIFLSLITSLLIIF